LGDWVTGNQHFINTIKETKKTQPGRKERGRALSLNDSRAMRRTAGEGENSKEEGAETTSKEEDTRL